VFAFEKSSRRQGTVEGLAPSKEKVAPEFYQVWMNVDLVERLIELSEGENYQKVLTFLQEPKRQIAEYMLLTISLTHPKKGRGLMDELLSTLLPPFIGNHPNSITVLTALWKNNEQMMIRGICELCNADQRVMNLSRVLDITQEIRDSFMKIVNCEDYKFTVNLGILAGKRDFLHYDVWLQKRLAEIGTPFIDPLIQYVFENIVYPLKEQEKKSGELTESVKNNILERSHLNKEKLTITYEHLNNLRLQENPKVTANSKVAIKKLTEELMALFPLHNTSSGTSEEIDNAANSYF